MKTRFLTTVLSTALFTAFLASTITPLAQSQQADRDVQQPTEPQAGLTGYLHIPDIPGESNASDGVEPDEIDVRNTNRAASSSEFSRTLTPNSGAPTTPSSSRPILRTRTTSTSIEVDDDGLLDGDEVDTYQTTPLPSDYETDDDNPEAAETRVRRGMQDLKN